jgi:hypothetical protein
MIYGTFTTNLFVSTRHCEDSKLQEEQKKPHQQLHLNVQKNKPKTLEICKNKVKTTMETYIKTNKQVIKNQRNIQ